MRKNILHSISFLLMVIGSFSIFVNFVDADAWWGEGYRKPEWVRANGGTTIKYTIKGTDNADKYKAMMFRDEKYVEVEFGKHAIFDDAKNGTYTINFYKCKNCKKHKYNNKTRIRDKDKLVASIVITARAGEANVLVFNASNNTVKLINRTGGYSGLNEFEQQNRDAKNNEGKICSYKKVIRKEKIFENLLFLSQKINHDLFFDENVDVGIIPQFLVKK